MTQLYVGNLSEDGDEKAIRSLFGRFGGVREVLMKNGYAFVRWRTHCRQSSLHLIGEFVFVCSWCMHADVLPSVNSRLPMVQILLFQTLQQACAVSRMSLRVCIPIFSLPIT